jgi:hypothetical protein
MHPVGLVCEQQTAAMENRRGEVAWQVRHGALPGDSVFFYGFWAVWLKNGLHLAFLWQDSTADEL